MRPQGQGTLARKAGMARILSAITPEAAEPTRIGRLHLQDRLGEGAMGIVYRAWDPELRRAVAIKLLRTPAGDGSRKILAEARALARLNDPNVVRVYDVGEQEGQLFINMEYVPGQSLSAYLETHPASAWARRIALVVAAARGLHAAHEAGMVHMDFKFDNVLVGDDGRVRVVDFGLARLLRAGDTGESGAIVGTPRYMAPEVRDARPADPRSDQYSFCRSIDLAFDDIPAAIRPIIDRGLSESPDDRWPSMEALADQLEAHGDRTGRDRVQRALLDRVGRVWIDGVLDQALDGADPVPLPLEPALPMVEAPFGSGISPRIDARDTHTLVRELNLSNSSMLVLGRPGAGKSTTLLLLARELLTRARMDPGHPVPVVLNLSSFSTSMGLDRWLRDEIANRYSLPARRVMRWLRDHDLILLLDGLDEVDEARRSDCIAAINEYGDDYGVPLIVACREDEYKRAKKRLRLDIAVRLQRLGDNDVTAYLLARGEHGATLRAAIGGEEIGDLARSPLWLTLCSRAGILPTAMAGDNPTDAVYDRYVDHVFRTRGVTDPQERQRIMDGLRWLARAMKRRGVTDLWLERIQADWLSTQTQSRSAVVIGMALVMLLLFVINYAGSFAAGGAPVGIGVGLGSILTAIAVTRTTKVKPREALRFSPRLALARTPLTVALLTIVSVVFGILIGDHVMPNVIGGIVGGLVGAAVRGLEPSDHVTRIRTNQGIRQSALNAAIYGGGVFVFSFLLFNYLVVPASVALSGLDAGALSDRYVVSRSLSAASFGGSVTAVMHGGLAVALHGVIRIFLALGTPLPFSLPSFLDRAADLALLRRVGGGYIFYHRTFLEYLAADRQSATGST